MLDGFVGNDALKNRLTALIENERLPHAVIIEGRTGTGRTTLAYEIARALVCDNGNACGKCINCIQAEKRAHADIIEYRPDKTVFGIDKVRAVNSDAMIKPNQARRKVLILRDCEQMNEAAQNAFLKTLEEPPGTVQFILITVSANIFLDTIISRCAVFTVVPPDRDTGLRLLLSRGYERQKAENTLDLCDGNIGKAIELLEGREESLGFDAGEIFELALCDKTYEMVKRFALIDKDRKKIALMIERLSALTESKLRNSAVNKTVDGFSVNGLMLVADALREAGNSLNANMNKALLLTVLCEKIIYAAKQ